MCANKRFSRREPHVNYGSPRLSGCICVCVCWCCCVCVSGRTPKEKQRKFSCCGSEHNGSSFVFVFCFCFCSVLFCFFFLLFLFFVLCAAAAQSLPPSTSHRVPQRFEICLPNSAALALLRSPSALSFSGSASCPPPCSFDLLSFDSNGALNSRDTPYQGFTVRVVSLRELAPKVPGSSRHCSSWAMQQPAFHEYQK